MGDVRIGGLRPSRAGSVAFVPPCRMQQAPILTGRHPDRGLELARERAVVVVAAQRRDIGDAGVAAEQR